jgi:hypothetical protein
MRHYWLATVGAGRWIDWRQRVVRSTLVFLGMRGASFGCRSAHALVLVRVVATSSLKPLSSTGPAAIQGRHYVSFNERLSGAI